MPSLAVTAIPTAVGPGQHRAPRHLSVVRFGQEESLEIEAGAVVTFPQGLVGMDALRRFTVIEDRRIAPCQWLQSLDDPSLAFLIVNPDLIVGRYQADISGEDAGLLEVEDLADADVLTIVTVHPDPSQSTVNLLAPVVINRKSRLGKQLILPEGRYSVRHPLMARSGSAPAPDQG